MSLVNDPLARDEDFLTGSAASPSDFVELLKPRVMSLVVFTALCGMTVAPGHLNPVVGFVALLAIAVGAGASGALNMVYDADVDAVMSRTRTRPIPDHRVSADEAMTFGLILAVLSVMVLGLVANWLAASLLAATIVFYAVVYTMWLKRWTPQNIVIGGAAGALPPVIGCAAATGSVSWDSILLFAIIFLWTPPHFWALALLKVDDYARAKIPMMPNAKGADRTRAEILAYSIVLAIVACLPRVTGLGGNIYGATALVAGSAFVWFALQVYRRRDGEQAVKAARHLFGYSILYVFLLFAVLLAEHAFPGASLL